MALPRSAMLSFWLNACLDGNVAPDDFAQAVLVDDPRHLVVDWPGLSTPFALEDLPAAVRGAGAARVALALPVAGDPLGLAGPASFNAQAVETGEAVLVPGKAGLGLVPVLDARTVLWSVRAAEVPPPLDPFEEHRLLRQVLLEVTGELVRLDVASWQPEIPDLLLNLTHRDPPPLPPAVVPRAVEAVDRADLCLEIVDLARRDDGGALSAYEAQERTRCLGRLEVAARRTLVAFGSASLGAP